jgi:hypothetical protein
MRGGVAVIRHNMRLGGIDHWCRTIVAVAKERRKKIAWRLSATAIAPIVPAPAARPTIAPAARRAIGPVHLSQSRSADRCRARDDNKRDGKQTYPEPPRFFGSFFLFPRSSLLRHHAPTASQVEVRSSKHVIGYFSSGTPALVGPSPALVSTVQHHGGSSPRRPIDPHPFSGTPDPYCIPAACRISSSSRHIFTFVSGASRCWYAVMQAEEQNCMCQ